MRGSKAPPLELYLLYERRRLKITDYIRLLWLFRFHFFVCRHLIRKPNDTSPREFHYETKLKQLVPDAYPTPSYCVLSIRIAFLSFHTALGSVHVCIPKTKMEFEVANSMDYWRQGKTDHGVRNKRKVSF